MSNSYECGIGETFILNLVYTNYLGVPIDLTSHTVTFLLYAPNSPGSGAVATVTATCDSNGNIAITVPASMTTTQTAGDYVYLVKDTVGSAVTWLLRDKFTFTEVTALDV